MTTATDRHSHTVSHTVHGDYRPGPVARPHKSFGFKGHGMSRQGPPSSRRPGPHNTSHVRIMSCFNECVASLHTTPKSEHLLSFPRLTLEAPARPLDSIQPHCTHMSCTIQPTSKTYTASASSTLQCLALFLECFLASPQTGIVSSVSCPTNRFGEPCPQKTGQVTSRQCLTSLYLWTVPLTCWFFPMQITLYVPPLWASFWAYVPLWGAHMRCTGHLSAFFCINRATRHSRARPNKTHHWNARVASQPDALWVYAL